MHNKLLGELGEQQAASYLQRKGYRILARKFRAKTGEIDIICGERDTVIFVEVKTRRSTIYGFPAEAVNLQKQRKIINTAWCYLTMNRMTSSPLRFDILEVLILKEEVRINHIKNAFGE